MSGRKTQHIMNLPKLITPCTADEFRNHQLLYFNEAVVQSICIETPIHKNMFVNDDEYLDASINHYKMCSSPHHSPSNCILHNSEFNHGSICKQCKNIYQENYNKNKRLIFQNFDDWHTYFQKQCRKSIPKKSNFTNDESGNEAYIAALEIIRIHRHEKKNKSNSYTTLPFSAVKINDTTAE